MTTKAFHHNRRPFFVNPTSGKTYVTRSFSGTHEQWANQFFSSAFFAREAMERWPRGFYWRFTNALYFYYGGDTRDYLAAVGPMQRAIAELLEKVEGNQETTIHGGMEPGEPGQVWMPVANFGNAEAFINANQNLA